LVAVRFEPAMNAGSCFGTKPSVLPRPTRTTGIPLYTARNIKRWRAFETLLLLVPEPAEQEAIAGMVAMRANGQSLMVIRDAVRAQGFLISHETVRQCLLRATSAAVNAS
jgi:hypothetical protein